MRIALLLALLCNFGRVATTWSQSVVLTPVATGFTVPIDVRHCNDDRLFVAERNGKIKIINADGTVRPTPFLDISSKVSSIKGEQGFFSFAFSPNYKTSGKFYVSYSDSIGSQLYLVVEQYTISAADSNVADPASALTIITNLKQTPSHNGGCIQFGHDGYLYIFWGDGSAGGDALGTARNMASMFGKIVRIDVANSTPGQPYAIPPTNPFVGAAGNVLPELWAFGLRNPWRTSFDRITGDLWLADVGQDVEEEIDFQPDSSLGGEDYGWSTVEGNSCFLPPAGCNVPIVAKAPLHNYMHPTSRSIIGGYVYRNAESRDLWGMYIYSDYVTRWIDGVRESNGIKQGAVTRLKNDAGGSPISFGEDRYGRIYICFLDNPTLYRVDDANPNHHPKAYFTVSTPSPGQYDFHAAEGINLSYQWLFNSSPLNGAVQPALTPAAFGQYALVVSNLAGSSDTSATFLVAPLPVTFSSFTARRLDPADVAVTWTTASEQNNKGFEVQRKRSDEPSFTTIAFVPSRAPNGNSNVPLQYAYTDATAGRGTVQYRIRQINLDAGSSYTSIALVNSIGLRLNIAVTPNPANGNVHVITGANDVYLLKMVDINGKVVLQNRFTGGRFAFSTQTFSNGIYYVVIQSGKTQQSLTEKIIVAH